MEMVDMQLLAAKAAQEFTVLAKENDILLKENMRMKENYDDIQYEREKLLLELSNMDKLKSKAKQWELEKKILMEHLETTETRTKRGSSSTSEDAHTLMMESLAHIIREKNELETMMEMEKQMKKK
eukprot:301815_1